MPLLYSLCCHLSSLLGYCRCPSIPFPESWSSVLVQKDFTATEELACINGVNVLLLYDAPKIRVNGRKHVSAIAKSRWRTNTKCVYSRTGDQKNRIKISSGSGSHDIMYWYGSKRASCVYFHISSLSMCNSLMLPYGNKKKHYRVLRHIGALQW